MRSTTALAAVCLAAAMLVGPAAYSAARSKSPAPQDMPKPGPEHKVLEKDVGVWDGTIKMIDPQSGKAIEMKCVETTTMMTGGFWSIGTFKSEFAGQPFEGTGVTGYDPNKNKYVGSWADSISPQLAVSEGTFDEKDKIMTLTATITGHDGKPIQMQTVTKQIDSNTRHFTKSMKGEVTGGKMVQMFEIYYKRRPK
jgi:hypothetical protein